MKVFLAPLPDNLSKAMFRVAGALARYAPSGVEIVRKPEDADVQLLHVIGRGSLKHLRCERYVVLQYCYRSTEWGAVPGAWGSFWAAAEFVWSYYDLHDAMPADARFMEAPLGVDNAFLKSSLNLNRAGVMTSGYVSGPGAEAVEEVALAAAAVEIPVVHIGPRLIVGMERVPPGNWTARSGISDAALARLYSRSLWVSGLRHVEGFELPAAEGLLCGARPIMFDRPETRRWYDGFAEFIPECSGPPLVEILTELFSLTPHDFQVSLVSLEERAEASRRFSWPKIAGEFWHRLGSRNIASRPRSLITGGIERRTGDESPLGPIPAHGEGSGCVYPGCDPGDSFEDAVGRWR